eukprot:SAG31_NODE_24647_length_477_cov_0.719577_1_plen_30_part_10
MRALMDAKKIFEIISRFLQHLVKVVSKFVA